MTTSNTYEQEIEKHRTFYFKYLIRHKDKRRQILSELNPLITKFVNHPEGGGVIISKEYFETHEQIKTFLKKYWGNELLEKFEEKVPYKKSKLASRQTDGFWDGLFNALAVTFEESKEKALAENSYKMNFLNFLRECLVNQGLHQFIHRRDPRIYKRLNLMVVFKENRKEYYIARALLLQANLESEYLAPFYKNKPIIVHGKIVKASAISKLNVTSTLLLNDNEIELFGNINGFTWNHLKRDENTFAKCCVDETNTYLKNPNVEVAKRPFKNNSLTYVNQARIDEIKALKSKKWDLSKLISLCNELNQNSTIGSVISVAALQRTIVNHIPPIFGFDNFEQVAANYKTGRSIKKSLEHLNGSMKHISDNHLHAQISKTDSLPNMTQVDFSNDLDVLLAEICRVLKKN